MTKMSLILEQLAPASTTEYVLLFLLCLVSFFIGWFFGRGSVSSMRKKLLDYEKDKVKDQELAQGAFKADEETITTIPKGIKAVKTRERSGLAVHKDSDTGHEEPLQVAKEIDISALEGLDFSRLGKADVYNKDDLKQISGVGPFVEEKLNSIGIFTFEQISRFTEEDIKKVTDLTKFFPGRIERDDWIAQAKKLKAR